jgi:hypothetical protein
MEKKHWRRSATMEEKALMDPIACLLLGRMFCTKFMARL